MLINGGLEVNILKKEVTLKAGLTVVLPPYNIIYIPIYSNLEPFSRAYIYIILSFSSVIVIIYFLLYNKLDDDLILRRPF